MPREIVRLGERQLGLLTDALSSIGKTRKEWSEASGVSQTAISNFLGGKSGVSPERLAALVGKLDAWLDGSVGASLDEPQRNTLREHLYAVRMRGGLVPTDDVLQYPVGALPTDARNRIPRECDDEALATLERHPFTMSIFGPPMSGKSTVINLVVEKARERGYRVSRLDCSCVAACSRDQAFFDLAQVIAEDLRLQPPAGDSLSPVLFGRWLPSQCRATSIPQPGLLVFENLAALKPQIMGQLLAAIRALHNRRGETNLSMIVELGTRGPRHSQILEESRAHFFPRVRVGWFGEEHWRALTTCYGLENVADSGWKKIEDYVGGHPTMVQYCLWRLHGGTSIEALLRELDGGTEDLQAILSEMSHRFTSGQEATCDGDSGSPSREAHLRWWGQDEGQRIPKFLSRVFGEQQ